MNNVIIIGAKDVHWDFLKNHLHSPCVVYSPPIEPPEYRSTEISGILEFNNEQKLALLELAEELRISFEKLENDLQKFVTSQRDIDFELTRLSELFVKKTEHYRSFEPKLICTKPYQPKIKKSQYEKSSYQRSGFQSSGKLARGRI
jgi:hypothetical protein